MFHIYQIEGLRLYNTVFTDTRIQNNINRSLESFTKVETIAWTPRKIFGYSGTAVKTPTIRITEPLLNTQYASRESRISDYNRLLPHRLVSVFAYLYSPDSYDTVFNIRHAYDLTVRHPIWLYNTGRVLKTEVSGDSISIDLELQPYWEPINRYYWQWGNYIQENESLIPAGDPADDLNALPFLMDIENNPNAYFNNITYTNDFFMLDEERWVSYHDRLPHTYVATGISYGWTNNTSFAVPTDEYLFTATPKSVYQFRNLEELGGITLTITSTDGTWRKKIQTCVLNLNLLNADLLAAGYTGLTSDDIVYIADYGGMDTFVRRGDTIIRDVYPRWIYDTETLGQLGVGYNKINISYTNAVDKECAMMHIFRLA